MNGRDTAGEEKQSDSAGRSTADKDAASDAKHWFSDPEERTRWRQSPEKKRTSVAAGAITVFGGVALVATFAIIDRRSSDAGAWTWFGSVFLVYFGGLVWLAYRTYERKAFIDRRLIERRPTLAPPVALEDPLALELLWRTTSARIDYYHDVMIGQARTSFLFGLIAVAVGFTVLMVAVIAAAFAHTGVGSASAASVGAIGAAIGSYIGATFLKSMNDTSERLRTYFDQPVFFARLLAAERIATKLSPDQEDAARLEMLRAAVEFRPPKAAG